MWLRSEYDLIIDYMKYVFNQYIKKNIFVNLKLKILVAKFFLMVAYFFKVKIFYVVGNGIKKIKYG